MTPELRWALVADLEPVGALAALSPAERERYASAARPQAFLAGRALLRGLAGELLGVAPADVPLSAICPDCGGPHGAPTIAGSDLRVSLSHADGLVVAVARRGAALGVDVERSVLPAERLAAIGTLTGRASVRHWTRVEAVLKADGRGLRVDPSLVVIDTEVASLGGDRYVLHDAALPEGYTGSIAVGL